MKSDDGRAEWCNWCGEDIVEGMNVLRRGDQCFCNQTCMNAYDKGEDEIKELSKVDLDPMFKTTNMNDVGKLLCTVELLPEVKDRFSE